MHWNIQHRKYDPCIVVRVHVYLWSWECHILKCLLHLGIHLRHQLVEVWHLLRVVHSWWRPRLMQVLHTINPPRDVFWSLVSIFYRLNTHWRGAYNILALNVLQFQNCLILAVKGWLVKLRYAEILLGTIWLRHLKTCVDLTNGWDVVWHEWLQFRLQVDLLRFVSLDIFKELLDLRSN